MMNIMRRVLPAALIAVILTAMAGCRSGNDGSGGAEPASIQIKGSDTMVNLAQSWAENYMQGHPEASIAVTGGGSGTGIAALLNGTTDIAVASRNIKAKEMEQAAAKGVKPVEHTVAVDGIAVIVHPDNPLSTLTEKQLADIYTGKVREWKGVGGEDKRIVVLSRDRNSGTHVFFLEHVLRGGNEKGPEEYGSGVLMMPSTQAIVDEVMQNREAIGYIGLGYLNDKVKPIAVAGQDGEAVHPTVETVANRSYPISRPLLMYTDGEPSGAVADFLEFILSPKGQAVVTETGFVPVR